MSEVGVAELRKDLKGWVARAQAGEEVVVTDRGRPVARLTGVASTPALERLVSEGRVSQPHGSRTPARTVQRVRAATPVSDYIAAERGEGRG